MTIIILTLHKVLYEGKVISLLISIKNSSFQLLDYHTSMIISIKNGNLQLQPFQEKDKLIDRYLLFKVNNGLLEVNNSIIKIFINS